MGAGGQELQVRSKRKRTELSASKHGAGGQEVQVRNIRKRTE
jgi:hypothetical protein